MTVLLTGTYSSRNKGDLAMQLTAARLLQERGATVASCVPFPDLDGSVYAAAGVEVVPSNRRKLIRASWQLVRLGLWRLTGRRFSWLVGDRNLEPFRRADLVVDLSGDMLTEDYGPHVAYSHFIPLIKALLLERPLVVLAQSIGPFRFTRPLAKAILRRADLITVRDPVSRDYLLSLGLAADEVTADLAFALEPVADERTDELWRVLGVTPGAQILGVSVSGLVASHHRKRAPGDADFYQEMATALDKFAAAHEAEIVFFPHVTGPAASKDDRIVAEQVRNLMTGKSLAVVEDLAPAEIKGMIATTTWFVGCRMHSNIAALSTGVPVAAIAYSHKTLGIMSGLGLQDYVLDVADVTSDAVAGLLERVVSDAIDIKATLAREMPGHRARAVRNVELALAQMEAGAR